MGKLVASGLWLMGGWVAGLVLGGALLWLSAPRQECRVLEVTVQLEGADNPKATGAYLPVGTRLLVDRADQYASELLVPVRLPDGAPTSACDGGWSW